ncbi:MAG: DUF2264 domain-containing protein [Spirochaetaceae bacterium]|nr:DUF2264 domain-containing protein [Spirochaetaceae bacterium]
MILYDLPITHNKLETRDDVAKSLKDILDPCGDALVGDNTGLFVGNTMAHYSPRGTLLEGWSRLLWGIVPLRAGGYSWSNQDKHFEGLINGTNKENKYYWGDLSYGDQRIVEMAAIALSLLLTPQYYWDPLTSVQKDNLISWLSQVNHTGFTHNNWLYFRILVNMAFEKIGRDEFNPSLMESDISEIEDMYEADGWYHDYVPFDNYNPWAMQYYSLIYTKFRADKDVERCDRFKKRVKLFAYQYIYYLNNEGANVPYGRSLTYRFGALSFFSACAFAGIEVLPWGVMKSIVLKNLRWWFKQPIFDRDGFLTIGYVNPSLIIGEQYNAPGSPYWGLKIYLILALGEDHPFWSAKEQDLPKLEKTKLLKVPGIIMQRTSDDDVVMLNAGQYPPFHMMHNAEKYAKFCYSVHYGFSASSSYYDFEKCGCDSMLYFSDDGDYFRPRRDLKVIEKNENYVSTLWYPYKDVEVLTYLVPYKDYHVRVHKINTKRDVITREGGFAISLYHENDLEIKPKEICDNRGSISIELPWDVSMIEDVGNERVATSIKPTPNLNYISTDTIVPILEDTIAANTSRTYVSLVGASRNNREYYSNRPKVTWDFNSSVLNIDGKKIIFK